MRGQKSATTVAVAPLPLVSSVEIYSVNVSPIIRRSTSELLIEGIARPTKILTVLFLIVPALMFFAGCTAQHISSGGNSKSGGTATILPHGVSLETVNGESVSMFSNGAEVPAGPVVAVFDVDQASYQLPDRAHSVLSIHFDAVAGMTYIITGRRGDGRLCAFPKLENGQPDLTSPAGCVTRE